MIMNASDTVRPDVPSERHWFEKKNEEQGALVLLGFVNLTNSHHDQVTATPSIVMR